MHNRVLLTRSNSRVESFHNVKSVEAAQAIINRKGKNFMQHGYKIQRFKGGKYYDSDYEMHKLIVR